MNSKRHKVELSIQKGGWFERSNLTFEEIKLTYWWCRGVEQGMMRFEVDAGGVRTTRRRIMGKNTKFLISILYAEYRTAP